MIDRRCVFIKLTIVLLWTSSASILLEYKIVIHRTRAAEATTTTVNRRLILRLASTIIEVRQLYVLDALVEATITGPMVASVHNESVVLDMAVRATCWTHQGLLLLVLLLA